ncbi:hypothetical protein MYU51_001795 [Penicillium brevicompactum]
MLDTFAPAKSEEGESCLAFHEHWATVLEAHFRFPIAHTRNTLLQISTSSISWALNAQTRSNMPKRTILLLLIILTPPLPTTPDVTPEHVSALKDKKSSTALGRLEENCGNCDSEWLSYLPFEARTSRLEWLELTISRLIKAES